MSLTADMSGVEYRRVSVNGIEMQIAEQGGGPLVLCVHGFPETHYSWRHQFAPLAGAGYRVVAPDMRGYGATDAPDPIDAYTIHHLVGDVVGLCEALGETEAMIVGHDWGAMVAWSAVLQRPDLFTAISAMSVPYPARIPVRPSDMFAALFADRFFYMSYFQDVGPPEAEMEADVRRWLAGIYHTASGEADPAVLAAGTNLAPESEMSDGFSWPTEPSAWLGDADLDAYAAAFSQSGFRGPLNWYRNLDRNHELTAAFQGAQITVPTQFIAGGADAVIAAPGLLDSMELTVTDMRELLLIDGAGHWVQQEAPTETNAALLRFLADVRPLG